MCEGKLFKHLHEPENLLSSCLLLRARIENGPERTSPSPLPPSPPSSPPFGMVPALAHPQAPNPRFPSRPPSPPPSSLCTHRAPTTGRHGPSSRGGEKGERTIPSLGGDRGPWGLGRQKRGYHTSLLLGDRRFWALDRTSVFGAHASLTLFFREPISFQGRCYGFHSLSFLYSKGVIVMSSLKSTATHTALFFFFLNLSVFSLVNVVVL